MDCLPSPPAEFSSIRGAFARKPRGMDDRMDITISEFGDTGMRIVLVGKLDIVGAGQIELPLATVAGSRNNVVIDMTGVSFIASIGIRHLVLAAKAVSRASRRLVLLDPTPTVTEVLTVAGLNDLLPIVRTEDEARAAFGSTGGG